MTPRRQLVSPMTAVIVSKVIIAISALIGTVAILLLTLSIRDQREFNHCISNLDSEWRRSVGLGLAAVAEEDDDELLRQTRIIRRLSQEEC